jgi:hypothetical protein
MGICAIVGVNPNILLHQLSKCISGEAIKVCVPMDGACFSTQKLSTDSIGNTTVTFQGINANSEIRVYLPDGTEAAGVELCNANHVLTWGVYSPGSANNTVRVVVVHPDYKIKEFDYTAAAGNASLPIQQELDRWYSNPI